MTNILINHWSWDWDAIFGKKSSWKSWKQHLNPISNLLFLDNRIIKFKINTICEIFMDMCCWSITWISTNSDWSVSRQQSIITIYSIRLCRSISNTIMAIKTTSTRHGTDYLIFLINHDNSRLFVHYQVMVHQMPMLLLMIHCAYLMAFHWLLKHWVKALIYRNYPHQIMRIIVEQLLSLLI